MSIQQISSQQHGFNFVAISMEAENHPEWLRSSADRNHSVIGKSNAVILSWKILTNNLPGSFRSFECVFL